MPRYFFHLRFGQRVLPDEEGIELSTRTAARDEALAIVRDLANPEIEDARRRWASWFLEVADERGWLFRTHIAHPPLELEDPDRQALGGAEPKLRRVRTESALPAPLPVIGRAAEVVREMEAARQWTSQLLKENHRIRRELLLACLASQDMRMRIGRVIRDPRGVTFKATLEG